MKMGVAMLSVASNTLLISVKVFVGIMSGSVSIISEAIHSGIDLVAAIIAFLAVRASGKPADEKHPFGHGKFENISGFIEAILIFVAAVWIFMEAVRKIIHPQPVEHPSLGVAVMFVSAVVNMIVSGMLFKIGKRTDSLALQADGWHLRTDVYTSVGVMGALAVIWLGQRVAPGVRFEWIDPVAAIAVAVLITKAAWDLTRRCVRDLLDVSLSSDEEKWIRSYVRDSFPQVKGIHGIRSRKAGSNRFFEFHMVVDGTETVTASHRISETIEQAVERQFPGSDVVVHIEPCDHICSGDCANNCFRPE